MRRQGLSLLERNFSCRLGEIDLVMQQSELVVFVEIRYRQRRYHGSGADSVTFAKQRRLSLAAAMYLARRPALASRPCRFDVVSITGPAAQADISWVKNAFESIV